MKRIFFIFLPILCFMLYSCAIKNPKPDENAAPEPTQFVEIPQKTNAPLSTAAVPEESAQSEKKQFNETKVDWKEIAGYYSVNDLIRGFGEPENIIDSADFKTYQYPDFSVLFYLDHFNNWIACGINNTGGEWEISIEGLLFEQGAAKAILLLDKNGYDQETGAECEELYFTKADENGELLMVVLIMENGKLSGAEGLWGIAAQKRLDEII